MFSVYSYPLPLRFLRTCLLISLLSTLLIGTRAHASTEKYSQLVTGYSNACLILTSRQVECWGDNSKGQLGLGYVTNYDMSPYFPSVRNSINSPTLVPGLSDVESLYLGQFHSCAVLTSGQVKCWGNNDVGQLGVSDVKWNNDFHSISDLVLSPSLVRGLSDVQSLSMGNNFTCALLKSEQVKCWGYNWEGELGLGFATTSQPYGISQPTLVPGLSNVEQIKSNWGYTCALLGSGELKCWGLNREGQLGTGAKTETIPQGIFSPTTVPSLSNVREFDLRTTGGCAVLYSNQVKCWGLNYYSELGQGNSSTSYPGPSYTPVLVPNLGQVKSVSVSSYGTCAILVSGQVRCWGKQLFSNSVNYSVSSPITNQLVQEFHLGNGSGWAVLINGQVTCWGSNIYGELGLGYSTSYPSIVDSPTLLSGVELPPLVVTPDAPALRNAAVVGSTISINFTEPNSNGGAEILGYEYSINGGSTWEPVLVIQSASQILLSGLEYGKTHLLGIRARNSAGSGIASNFITLLPIAPASAPTISGVTAGNRQATLSLTAPSQINDSSLSGFDYSINNGLTWSRFPSVTGPFTITGLTNATAYQVKVRAVNSAGAGEASAAVTVNPTRLIPTNPVIASVVGGNSSATVNIATPTGVTAQSITGYQYSIDKGATYQNAVVSNGSFTISGLTNGVSTSVQIRATNFNGNSLASVAKTVIPATTPAAPSITTITPSVGALSIAFTAPDTGGSAITSYQYSLDGGSTWVVPKTAVKTSPIKIAGLPNGTSYQVKIRAVNSKGIGSASEVVNATTPVLVPSAPVTTSIAKTSTTFIVDVTAPTNNGGGEITNYAYSIDYGKTWTIVSPASNSTRIVIAGLTPNKLYPVQIAAINRAGRGVASAKYNAVTLR